MYGLYENECFVTISGNQIVGKHCSPKGTTCNFIAGKYTVCCCNTSNCNDDAFVEKCKARILPTTKPEGFSCLNSASHSMSGVSTIFQECSGKLDLFDFTPYFQILSNLCSLLF